MTTVKEDAGTAPAIKSAIGTAIDARGRLISVKRLNALNYYDLTKALGAFAGNSATMDMAIIAGAVVRINTTDYATPKSEADVRFVLQELDFDGIAAASEALKNLAPDTDAEKNTAKN